MTPREGIRWSILVPRELRPKSVERAVAEVERLQTLVAEEAEALARASAALDEAEKADVQALATAFRSGSTAKSQAPQVEKLRADVRAHERRVEASRAALAAAESDVGVELHAQRGSWLAAVEREAEKERAACRARLDQLDDGLSRLATMRGLVVWLSGDDLTKAARTRGLGAAPSSARFMANAEPADAAIVLSWVRECVDPPLRDPPPVLHTAAGPASRAAEPVEAA